MLHWLEFRDRQAYQRPRVKSLKIAARVGARDICGVVSHIVFGRKIAQRLHWLGTRTASFLRSPFLTMRFEACKLHEECVKRQFRVLSYPLLRIMGV